MTASVYVFDVKPSPSNAEYAQMKCARAYVYVREDAIAELELMARAYLVEEHFEIVSLVETFHQMRIEQCPSPEALQCFQNALGDGACAFVVAKGLENMGGDAAFN